VPPGAKNIDELSQMTSFTAAAAESSSDDQDLDEDDVLTVTSTPGNLHLVLRIMSGMCDGQYTDLQASYVIRYVAVLTR